MATGAGSPSLAEQHAFLDAAKSRDFARVRSLLLANPTLVNCQPCGRWSALHQFSEGGDRDAVAFLLQTGASKSLLTLDGKTPQEVAKANVLDLFTAEASSSSASTGLVPSSISESATHEARIRALYSIVNASKLEEVDDLISKYVGKEQDLFYKIVKKYNVSAEVLAQVTSMAAASSSMPVVSSSMAVASSALGQSAPPTIACSESKHVASSPLKPAKASPPKKARLGTYEKAAAKDGKGKGKDGKNSKAKDQFGHEEAECVAADVPAFEGSELNISRLKASITAKRDWKVKIMSAHIVQKWRKEADSQYCLAGEFDEAIKRLKNDEYYDLSGIAHVDGLLPSELIDRIVFHLDCLAKRSDDFHPHSGKIVRNLIHPSLYHYVHGESFPPHLEPSEHKAPRIRGKLYEDRIEVSKSDRFAHCLVGVEEWSRHQWLPAEVDVDGSGSATFASYVSNAPRDPELYKMLEDTFSQLLPSFEQVVTPPGARKLLDLKNRRLQVIVKAANYELKPGQSYKGGWHVEGMLHERIVAAGILYYASSPNMCGDGLAFRRLRNRNVVGLDTIPTTNLGGNEYGDSSPRVTVGVSDAGWLSTSGVETPPLAKEKDDDVDSLDAVGDEEEEADDMEDEKNVPTGFVKPKFKFTGDDVRPESLWNVGYKSQSIPNYIDLGVVETPVGRALVFKNSMQHCVQMLCNSSATETAFRKVLIFWLVDPDKRVLSTADVPNQQWDHNRVQIAQTLQRQWRPVGKTIKLPVNPIKLILGYAKYGFTKEEALQNRLKLMEERSFSRRTIDSKFEALIRREYSFCEH